MHALHLPGALKIDPPGSTRHWCCLSPKRSAGDMKRSALPLKRVSASLNKSGGAHVESRTLRQVSCATCKLREAGIVYIGGAGSGSSGLSRCGVAKGGLRGLASRGERWVHLRSGSLSHAKVLGDV